MKEGLEGMGNCLSVLGLKWNERSRRDKKRINRKTNSTGPRS